MKYKCFWSALLFLVSSLCYAGNGETQQISFDIKNLSLSEAIKKITEVAGEEITLIGPYMPPGHFSLRVRDSTLDEAIKRLLKNYNYYALHSQHLRFIFITGPVDDIKLRKAITISAQTWDGPDMDLAVAEKLLEYISQNDSESYEFDGQYVQMEDGSREWIQNDNTSGNSVLVDYEYAYMPDGKLEVIPVQAVPNLEEQFSTGRIELSPSGPDGVMELIVDDNGQNAIEWKMQVGPEGILEVVPTED